MSASDSPYFEDWKQIARKDLGRMQLLLNSDDLEGAAYFLQQSIEKYLKAWLLERGWPLKKTHELSLLLSEACNFDPALSTHEVICDRLAGYYFSQRYPALIESELTRDDIEADISNAKALISDLFPDSSGDEDALGS